MPHVHVQVGLGPLQLFPYKCHLPIMLHPLGIHVTISLQITHLGGEHFKILKNERQLSGNEDELFNKFASPSVI